MNKYFLPALICSFSVFAIGCADSSEAEKDQFDRQTSLPTVTRQKASAQDMEPTTRPLGRGAEAGDWAKSISIEVSGKTPEAALRSFLKAMAVQDLDLIKSTCIEHPDLEVLIRGDEVTEHQGKLVLEIAEKTLITSYEVGDSFVLVTKEMVVNESMVNEDRKLLTMPGNPVPFPIYRIDDLWKVDPSGIVTVRKSAARLERENSR